MALYCFPLIDLSICAKEVLLAYSNEPAKLFFTKKGQTCSVELTPINGELLLTDTEILDYFDTANVFLAELRKVSDNSYIPFNYWNCYGNFTNANKIKLQFNDCENSNDVLSEVCYE